MSREYGKVAVTFWSRGSGKRLRGDYLAQLIALHLPTCRFANGLGVFYIPIPAIAHEVGSPIEGASKALARTIEAGFCEYDLASEMVWIPNHAKIEIGPTLSGGDRRKPHIQEELEALGNHPFAAAFWEIYGVAYGLTKPKALASPFEGPWEPLVPSTEAPSKPNTKQSKGKSKAKAKEILAPDEIENAANNEIESRGNKPTPIAQVRRAFLDGYAARYPLAPPYPWGKREGGQAKNWLASVTLEEALDLVRWFFVWKRPEVIKAGHPFGLGSGALTMRYVELRADLAHPERRAFAAAVNNDEQQAIHNAESAAQSTRVVAQILGAPDADPFRPIASNGSTPDRRNQIAGRSAQQADE